MACQGPAGCTRKALLWCTGPCGGALYCSQECGRKQWPRHYFDCTGKASLTAPLDIYSTENPDDDHSNDYFSGRAAFLRTSSPEEISQVMDNRLWAMTQLSLENKNKLYIHKDFPIDHDAVSEWIQRVEYARKTWLDLSDEDPSTFDVEFERPLWKSSSERIDGPTLDLMTSEEATTLARAVAQSMNYVGKTQFLDAVVKEARFISSFRNSAFVKELDTKFVWLMHFPMNKSPLWVSTLMWPHLENSIDAIVRSTSEIHALRHNERLGWKNIAVIIVDDASYSGEQISNVVQFFAERHEGETEGISFHLHVPFVSTQAVINIWAAPIDISARDLMSKEMQTFEEFTKRHNSSKDLDRIMDSQQKVGRRAFIMPIKRAHVPTYFAHKLPDWISTPNHIMALAPYLDIDGDNRKITVRFKTLIKGCDEDAYRYLDPNEDALPGNDFDQDAGGVCPFPIYKAIRYTMGGEDLHPHINIMDWADQKHDLQKKPTLVQGSPDP